MTYEQICKARDFAWNAYCDAAEDPLVEVDEFLEVCQAQRAVRELAQQEFAKLHE